MKYIVGDNSIIYWKLCPVGKNGKLLTRIFVNVNTICLDLFHIVTCNI